VLDAQREIQERAERNPMRFYVRDLPELLDGARTALASFVGASTEGLAFVPNVTTAVNAVLRSFPFVAGDAILVTNHGYNACSNAARYVAGCAGLQVHVAEIPFPIASPEEATRAVLAAVRAETKMAIIDHVTSPTALRLPIEELVPALQERGIVVFVDGAHGVGLLPLNLDALGADYYSSNCHKWLCAPKGSAFLYAPRHMHEVRPLCISNHANRAAPGADRFRVEFDWPGTDDFSAFLTVPVAISIHDPGAQATHRSLVLWAREHLCAALSLAPPAPECMITAMASLVLKPATHPTQALFDPLHAALAERGIEVPVFGFPCAPARVLRISAQSYNTRDDYEALSTALQEMAL
jgi:isopenicillin-N epimerase